MFKICPLCKFEWKSRAAFLRDTSLRIVGYQANFTRLEEGLFLFNHSCGTTLAIPAGEFADLYDGPIFRVRREDASDCPEYCLNSSDLRRCPKACECAYVREILDMLIQKKIPDAALREDST